MSVIGDPLAAQRNEARFALLGAISVSQAERFDHQQYGGCGLAWWFERRLGIWAEGGTGTDDGVAGHAHLARYFTTGEMVLKKAKMRKAVNAAIIRGNTAGELPKPGPDLLVEWRFSGQPQRDELKCACGHIREGHHEKGCEGLGAACQCEGFEPAWIPVDVSKTLWLGGVPWDGMVDLAWRREETPDVRDHKFSSDPRAFAKKRSELITTIQMPLYTLALLRRAEFADANQWRIGHHNISRKGVDSFIRAATVSLDQVREREADIVRVVGEMEQAAQATDPLDVPFNLKSCDARMGCPHQSICPRFKQRQEGTAVNNVELSPEELAIFDGLDDVAPAAPAPAPVAAAPAPASAQIPDSSPPLNPKKPSLIMPPCGDCGTDLNPENSSQLRSGAWKHIGCPAAQPVAPVTPPDEPAPSPTKVQENATSVAPAAEPEKPKRGPGRPKKVPDAAPPPVPASAAPPPVLDTAFPTSGLDPSKLSQMEHPEPAVMVAPPAVAVVTLRLELGPETLAILRALTGK